MSCNTYTLLFQRKVKKMVEMSKHTMRELKFCRRSKKPHQICRYLSTKTEDPPCFCCSYCLLDFNKWSSPCNNISVNFCKTFVFVLYFFFFGISIVKLLNLLLSSNTRKRRCKSILCSLWLCFGIV
jgi:hypothetical protein